MSAHRLACVVLVALAFTSGVVRAQPSLGGADHYFRIESEQRQTKRGPAVSGYVHNDYGQNAERVRLRVEGLDTEGKTVSSTFTWIVGGVPRFGRSYFETRVPGGAATYRITVVSVDWSGFGGTGGM